MSDRAQLAVPETQGAGVCRLWAGSSGSGGDALSDVRILGLQGDQEGRWGQEGQPAPGTWPGSCSEVAHSRPGILAPTAQAPTKAPGQSR